MQDFNRKTILFIGAVGIQLVGLLVLGLAYGSVVAQGSEVLLKIAPVDPRDPLRGDYVTFRYDISTLPNYLVESSSSSFVPSPGIVVYVALRSGRPYWQATGVYSSLDRAQQATGLRTDTVIIKGTIMNASGFDGSLSVRYDIEQYFIPEGTGRTIDFWNKEMSASVKVDSNGNSILRQLFMNGQPWPSR